MPNKTDNQSSLQQYIDLATELGALHTVEFDISQIVFEPRTILKCMFGCTDWGKGHTCPSRPGAPSIFESIELFKRYKRGIIIHHNDQKMTQKISYEIERRAFCDGFYLAMSLSDCALCKTCCGRNDKPCANPQKARPAFHSIGIDVFATVRAFGLPLETLTNEDDTQNWYSAVFID